MTRLSETQTTLLSAAAARADGALLPPPDTLKAKGAALDRTLRSLVRHGFAVERQATATGAAGQREACDATALVISEAGLRAIGIEPDAPASSAPYNDDAPEPPKGKLGVLLSMVRGADGATIAELAEAVSWQSHTTRAALTRLRQRGFDIQLRTCGERKAYHLERSA